MSNWVKILCFPVQISQFVGKKDYPNNNSLKKKYEELKISQNLVIKSKCVQIFVL